MDDLLKIAGNVMENFNPETDSANDFENLPDGNYVGLITEVTNRKNEKGTNWISIKVEVSDGEYKGRVIFVSIFFTEKQIERAIKTTIKMVHDLGFEDLSIDAFKSLEVLAENLQAIVGTEVAVEQKTSKSGYANHTVTANE